MQENLLDGYNLELSYHILVLSNFQPKKISFKKISFTYNTSQRPGCSSLSQKKNQWAIVNGKAQDIELMCHEASKKFCNWNIAVFIKDQRR